MTWTLVERPDYAYLFPNEKLAQLFEGADSPLDDANATPRSIQFELVVGAHFALGEATLVAEEPDYVLAYGTDAVGIAAKRLSSVKPEALEKRLREGARQIQKHTDHGFVAVLAFGERGSETFPSLRNWSKQQPDKRTQQTARQGP